MSDSSIHHQLRVGLGERAYDIHIGPGLLAHEDVFAPVLCDIKQVVVVTNSTVAPLFLSKLEATLNRLQTDVHTIVLPDGEAHKNWETLNTIFDALLSAHCERHTPLIALGGGVIGDIAGFAAACYQRGMPFIQVPTTLLAQVDSSVGGKTAINHPLGKNMIGAFYQPCLVVADTHTLTTLPTRELQAGCAEIVKYGLIRDAGFFEWLETHADALRTLEAPVVIEAIARSCAHKAEVVATDEREKGERALLNFGHTFGHAIETGAGYGHWLHGEAVAAGMVMASELSMRLGWLPATALNRIRQLLQRFDLPIEGPKMLPQRYLGLMRHDKKVRAGQLNLVLLQSIGEAIVSAEADEATICASISATLKKNG